MATGRGRDPATREVDHPARDQDPRGAFEPALSVGEVVPRPESDPTAGVARVANAAAGEGYALPASAPTAGVAWVANAAGAPGPREALALLGKIDRHRSKRRGRTKGSTYWSEARLRAAIPGACDALVLRNRRRPTQLEVGAELGIPASTFDRYLTAFRLRAWLNELLGGF